MVVIVLVIILVMIGVVWMVVIVAKTDTNEKAIVEVDIIYLSHSPAEYDVFQNESHSPVHSKLI